MDLEAPGPDDVQVIAVLETQGRNWLVEAADSLRGGTAWDPGPDFAPRLPSEFKLDKSFGAVPLGNVSPPDFEVARTISRDFLEPRLSRFFIVRGFVEAKSPAAIPVRIQDNSTHIFLYSDPTTCPIITCANHRPVGSIIDVQRKLNVAGLATKRLDGRDVAVAIVDSGIYLRHLTRRSPPDEPPADRRPHPRYPVPQRQPGDPPIFDDVNSWRPARLATPPGNHRIGHGTMCAYDVLAVAPKATLLDFPMLIDRSPGDHSVTGTVAAAFHAYWRLLDLWATTVAPGSSEKYKALVVNNSWGVFHPCEEDFLPGQPGRYIDNWYHPLHAFIQILVNAGIDMIFAAGNAGLPCPMPSYLHNTSGSIMGANAYPEVLTVAGCDVNDTRVGYSSQGPSIPMFPQGPQFKPDLTAYTHFLGSQVQGERQPDSGTSAASPIAAGCVAALRTAGATAATSPAQLFKVLKDTARSVGTPGWNADFGYGIIDPAAAARMLGL